MLGVMYALVAVGFTLFFGVLDVIHFSHGDIIMLGAFTGLTVLAGLKAAGVGGALLALPLTFAASILVTGAIGVLAERVCVKPLAGTSPLMTLLATLSLGLVIREAVLIFYPRGAGLAAVAGILSWLYYSEIHFIMGITGGVIGFSAAAIGGLGNVYGAIIGGLLFGVLQTTAAALIPRGSEFRDVVAFAVVMVF